MEPKTKKTKNKGKKGKKNKKHEESSTSQELLQEETKESLQQEPIAEKNPSIDLTNEQPMSVFAMMVAEAEKHEEAALFFDTTIGVVRLSKTKSVTTGVSSIRWMLDGARATKAQIITGLVPRKTAPSEKEIKADAKDQMLLTTKQLSKKYKSKKFVEALGFMEFGKKKLRKKAIKKISETKKITGDVFTGVMNGVFDDIPTSDFFRMFEIAEG